MKEIIEMARMLLEMDTDTYLRCKYAMLVVSRGEPGPMEDFARKLFSLTDSRRPLQIGEDRKADKQK